LKDRIWWLSSSATLVVSCFLTKRFQNEGILTVLWLI
jgi:hypothetical protein